MLRARFLWLNQRIATLEQHYKDQKGIFSPEAHTNSLSNKTTEHAYESDTQYLLTVPLNLPLQVQKIMPSLKKHCCLGHENVPAMPLVCVPEEKNLYFSLFLPERVCSASWSSSQKEISTSSEAILNKRIYLKEWNFFSVVQIKYARLKVKIVDLHLNFTWKKGPLHSPLTFQS